MKKQGDALFISLLFASEKGSYVLHMIPFLGYPKYRAFLTKAWRS